jgi:anaerobic selenocysteine-containing dehydrogenase
MHDCPDTCAWIITKENGKAVQLQGDPDHPMTRGTLWEKMDGFLTDVVYNSERVLHPLKRATAKGEGRFERVSWDQALDDVAARLRKIIDQHGAEAILLYSYYGTMGMVQAESRDRRFFRLWRSCGARDCRAGRPRARCRRWRTCSVARRGRSRVLRPRDARVRDRIVLM